MDKRIAGNIGFIILIAFLAINAFKAQQGGFSLPEFGKMDSYKEQKAEPVVMNEFENLKDVKRTDNAIDINTARDYLKEIQLSGTQMLELNKVKKISPYLNTNKKVVIYVTNEQGSDVEAFLKEFANTRNHFANSSDVVFLPLENVWNISEENIKNSHDRVIYNLQKECGLFCVIMPGQEKLVRLKGANVNKKTAQIMHVYLTH